jgi:hypothetical protein
MRLILFVRSDYLTGQISPKRAKTGKKEIFGPAGKNTPAYRNNIPEIEKKSSPCKRIFEIFLLTLEIESYLNAGEKIFWFFCDFSPTL